MRYVALGALDGIITAGTLSAYSMLKGGGVSPASVLPLAVVVATINSLTVFVAEYAQQRSEMREVAQRLFVRWRRWTLVHRRALLESAKGGLATFAVSLLGALAVLAPAAVDGMWGLASLAAATAGLGLYLAEGSDLDILVPVGAAVALGLLVGLYFPVA